MKSDVKKKMMLDEHTTHTPKSLNRAREENFFPRNVFHHLVSDKILSRSQRKCTWYDLINIRLKTTTTALAAAGAPTDFILFPRSDIYNLQARTNQRST
jgi:hypothetical protein